MRKILVIILFISSLHVIAQQENSNVNLRFGSGLSLLGTGDMITLNVENEVNYIMSQIFTGSASLNYGRSTYGVYEAASFFQGNLNFFLAPFGNTTRNVFRIGTGLSYYSVTDVRKNTLVCGVGQTPEEVISYETRNAFGYNVIIENTYAISDRFLIGLKLFTQPYFNGDINSGVLLKGGLVL
ncbi:MAG: hypothetical protein K9J27_10770 [Bacteroidales bacterium]|nr:hypothetical protein [Bacteroidales bacterium]MCF8333754.1 hypothetical protein [Bacteroidales bacterium]